MAGYIHDLNDLIRQVSLPLLCSFGILILFAIALLVRTNLFEFFPLKKQLKSGTSNSH